MNEKNLKKNLKNNLDYINIIKEQDFTILVINNAIPKIYQKKCVATPIPNQLLARPVLVGFIISPIDLFCATGATGATGICLLGSTTGICLLGSATCIGFFFIRLVFS